MKNVTEFIDKSVAEIQSNLLFKELFKDSDIKVVENYYYIEGLDNGLDLVLTSKNVVNSIHLFPNFKLDIPFKLKFPPLLVLRRRH